MKSQNVTIQMKAVGQYFLFLLFMMLYDVIRTFESVDKILLSCCGVYDAVQGDSNF